MKFSIEKTNPVNQSGLMKWFVKFIKTELFVNFQKETFLYIPISPSLENITVLSKQFISTKKTKQYDASNERKGKYCCKKPRVLFQP